MLLTFTSTLHPNPEAPMSFPDLAIAGKGTSVRTGLQEWWEVLRCLFSTVEISPLLFQVPSGDSEVPPGEARVKEVSDAHLQEMFERGEASGPIVNTLVAFAGQIRLLNGSSEFHAPGVV